MTSTSCKGNDCCTGPVTSCYEGPNSCCHMTETERIELKSRMAARAIINSGVSESKYSILNVNINSLLLLLALSLGGVNSGVTCLNMTEATLAVLKARHRRDGWWVSHFESGIRSGLSLRPSPLARSSIKQRGQAGWYFPLATRVTFS